MNARRTSLASLGAGWLVAALTVLPLLPAKAEPEQASPPFGRIEWLLAMHDARLAIHAPRNEAGCRSDAAEEKR